MKKVLFILSMLFSFAYGQNWNTSTQGGKTTITYFTGAIKADSGLLIPKVNSLTNYRFKDTVGALIRYQDSLYFRGVSSWINVTRGSGGSSVGWQTTLDNNSSLNKSNTVAGGGYDFTFDELNSFKINSSNYLDGSLLIDNSGTFAIGDYTNYTNGTNITLQDVSGNINYNAYNRHTFTGGGVFAQNLTNAISNKRLMFNSSTGEITYSDTTVDNLQQSLDNGSTLDKDNTVNAAGHSFTWDSCSQFRVNGNVVVSPNFSVEYTGGDAFFNVSADSRDAAIGDASGLYNTTYLGVNDVNSRIKLRADSIIVPTLPIAYNTYWKVGWDATTNKLVRDTATSSGGSGTVTSLTLGRGITGSSPITTTGTIGLDTTKAYTWTGANTFSGTTGLRITSTVKGNAGNFTITPNGSAIGTPADFTMSNVGRLTLSNFQTNLSATNGVVVANNLTYSSNSYVLSNTAATLGATVTCNSANNNGSYGFGPNGTKVALFFNASGAWNTGDFAILSNNATTTASATYAADSKFRLYAATGNITIGNNLADNATDKLQISGSLNLVTAGNKLKVAAISNTATATTYAAGTTTLSSGTITITTTAVTANSIIMLTGQSCSNCGHVYISARTAGTSFTISSTNVLDASIIGWQIIN